LSECYQRIAGNTARVWLVGSSIIKHAFVEAWQSPTGTNLGLERIGASLWWQGRSGLRLLSLKGHVRTLLRYEEPPNIILIHIGGNDLGYIKVGVLRNWLKNFFSWLQEIMPHAFLVWSQILPRNKWRPSHNLPAMDRARIRLNSSVGSFVLSKGGGYIRYPDIQGNNTFLCNDGVHLTSLGNSVFLNTIQGGLEAFLLKGARVYPDLS